MARERGMAMTRRRVLAAAGGAAALGMAAAAMRAAAAPARAEALHPPVGRFVTVEGLRVHWTEAGEGPPVVLIHGASGNLRDFTFSLMGRLAAGGVRAIAFDRPGFGYSERQAARGWEPAEQARLLRGAAAAIGAARPVVAGHSWGAAAAMAWAAAAPQEVAGVAVLAGATYPWGGDAGLLYRLGAAPVIGGLVAGAARLLVDPEAPEAILRRIFAPDPVPPGYGAHVGVGLALRPATFRANALDLHNLNAALTAQAPRYAGLPVRLEVVHGLADRTVWAGVHAEPLARAVPGARLTLLPGVGHMPHHAAEEACAAAILRLARPA
jgi:pimeloyl-ACP methyl ester carboxylesterase